MFSLVIDLLMPQLAWCGGLGGARKDADLFQQLFVIAQGDLRDLEIVRRTFGRLLLLVGGIVGGNSFALDQAIFISFRCQRKLAQSKRVTIRRVVLADDAKS